MNHLVCFDYRKKFLDPKNADVFFVFTVKNATTIRIPAHKSILAAGSPRFRMLFDEMKENSEIPLPAKIRNSFEEFLQFFYKNILTLTFENMYGVAKLCKCFAIIDRFKACEIPLLQALTMDNICTGYGVADFVGLTDVVKFCEQQIKTNAEVICSSENYMKMHPDIFNKVLQLLMSSSCDCDAAVLINSFKNVSA